MKKILKSFLAVCMFFALASTCTAQIRAIVPVERNPQAAQQAFYVQVSVDHENHVYREGENMVVTVKTNKDGYLYLIYEDAAKNMILLYPNKFEQNHRIKANESLVVPSSSMNFDLQARAPFGKEKLQAIVTLKPVDLQQNQVFLSGDVFKTLTTRDVNTFQNAARSMGVVERQGSSTSSSQGGDNDFAEFTTEITTIAKSEPTPTTAHHKRIFVGICVAKYADRKIPNLPACDKDLKNMASYFKQYCGCDNNDSLLYINEQATLAKIRDLFTNYLPRNTERGDEVIIYWTGHGNRIADTNGDEKDGYEETLVLYDSKRNDAATQLTDDEFGVLAQKLEGRKVLFILDTCHSGGMGAHTKSLDDADNLEWDFGFGECSIMKDLGQPNLAMIASCAASETSLIRLNQDMSVMSYYVMEALKSKKGLSHKDLYEAIKDRVPKYVKENFNAPQNVVIQDELESPMIINK